MYFEYYIPDSERCLPGQAIVFAAFFLQQHCILFCSGVEMWRRFFNLMKIFNESSRYSKQLLKYVFICSCKNESDWPSGICEKRAGNFRALFVCGVTTPNFNTSFQYFFHRM